MAILGNRLRPRVEALLASLSEMWSINSEGKLTTSDTEAQFYEASLVQLLDLSGTRLCSLEAQQCAERAIHDVLRAGTPTVDAFIQAFEVRASATRSTKKSRFYFQTKCHFQVPAGFWLPLDILGSRIVLASRNWKHLQVSTFRHSGYGVVDPDEPKHGTYCFGQLTSRSHHAALDEYADHLAVALGAANFWLNLGRLTWSMGGGGSNDVMAPLPQGREVILFTKDGTPHTEHFSYFTVLPASVKRTTGDDIKKLSRIGGLVRALSKIQRADQSFYRSIFKLYFDAITERDIDYQLVRLWKLAEIITFSGSSSPDVVAARLSMMWSDQKQIEAICFAAGHRRNAIVHGVHGGLRLRDVVEMFRHYVEHAVWLSLHPDFKTVRHWRNVLELATSGESIQELEEALPLVKRFIS